MIVWSGWGLLVIVFAMLGFFMGAAAAKEIVTLYPFPVGTQVNLVFLIGGALSAAMIYFFAAWREGAPARMFVDEVSGERMEVRASAGSLFFIPMRWWAWIILIVCAVLTYTGDARTFQAPP
jgi:hypothetical protein